MTLIASISRSPLRVSGVLQFPANVLGTDGIAIDKANGVYTFRIVAIPGALTIDASQVASGQFDDARISQSSVVQHEAAFILDAGQVVSGAFNDARIAESNVTQHEAALEIDAGQVASGTFNDARIAESSVTQHEAALAIDAGQIGSGTLDDARVAQSNVTQHEAALAIDEAQITGLGALATKSTVNNDDWDGADLAVANGGTGRSSATAYALIAGGTTDTGAHQSVSGVGTAGQVLTSQGAGQLPVWAPPAGAGREVLTADRDYYVRTDGDDGNDGLSDNSGGAFATLQHAYDTIAGTLDLGGQTVTVHVGTGTYAALLVSQPWTGGGAVIFEGDTSTPSNVVLTSSTAHTIESTASLPGILTIRGFRLTNTNSPALDCLRMSGPGSMYVTDCDFGPCTRFHINLSAPGGELHMSDLVISGDAIVSWIANAGGVLYMDGDITLTGTPTFTTFLYAIRLGQFQHTGGTVTGSAIGQRYLCNLNGVLLGSSILPGDVPGVSESGGQVV